MTEQYLNDLRETMPEPPKKRRRIWTIVGIVAGVVLLTALIAAIASPPRVSTAGPGPVQEPDTVTVTAEPKAAPPPVTVTAPAPPPVTVTAPAPQPETVTEAAPPPVTVTEAAPPPNAPTTDPNGPKADGTYLAGQIAPGTWQCEKAASDLVYWVMYDETGDIINNGLDTVALLTEGFHKVNLDDCAGSWIKAG